MNTGELVLMPYESQVHLAEFWHERCMRMEEKEVEAQISEQHQLSVYRKKKEIAERYKEYSRAAYDAVVENDDGELILERKNALINLGPSRVTDMRNVIVQRVYRSSDPSAYCYKLACDVSGRKTEIYLMAKKITDGYYIVRKLTTAGIGFYGRGKRMAGDIIEYLIVHKLEEKEVSVPDNPGWYMSTDGKLEFTKEGDLVWKTIERLSR